MKSILLFSIILLLGSCDAVPTDLGKPKPPRPRQLLLEINDQGRFMSTDQLADLLINQDPSLLLVDVRPQTDFQQFSLPQAVNVPLENLLDESAQLQIDCEKYMIVFYSHEDIYADQAWILKRRQSCQNMYVLKGGLNEWAQTIIQSEEPLQTASSEEWERYYFRMAARKYFTGGAGELEALPYLPPTYKSAPVKSVILKPKKGKEEEEGC